MAEGDPGNTPPGTLHEGGSEGVKNRPSDLIHADKAGSAEIPRGYDGPDSGIGERLARYGPARNRAALMGQFLGELAALGQLIPAHLGGRREVEHRADKLERCGCWLLLHDYFTLGQTRLVDGRFCNQPLLCPLCAIRRGSKLLRAHVERLATVLHECPGHGAYLVTLAVRVRPDLAERYAHLRSA